MAVVSHYAWIAGRSCGHTHLACAFTVTPKATHLCGTKWKRQEVNLRVSFYPLSQLYGNFGGEGGERLERQGGGGGDVRWSKLVTYISMAFGLLFLGYFFSSKEGVKGLFFSSILRKKQYYTLLPKKNCEEMDIPADIRCLVLFPFICQRLVVERNCWGAPEKTRAVVRTNIF